MSADYGLHKYSHFNSIFSMLLYELCNLNKCLLYFIKFTLPSKRYQIKRLTFIWHSCYQDWAIFY